MSKPNLTKQEAFELITPIVDDEVDEETRLAFFQFIQHDEEIRGQYQSAKRIKKIVETRCPCAKAPTHLKKRVSDFLADAGHGKIGMGNEGEPIYDVPCEHSVDSGPDARRSQWNRGIRFYAAAAGLIIAAFLGGYFLFNSQPSNIYNIEEYAYTHFMKHEGRMVTPTISTASLAGAELELAKTFDFTLTVPPLKNADFKGVVYSEFVEGYKAPMLEYHLPSEDQYVYIFAFKINDLRRYNELRRSEEAIRSCINKQDFHIRIIDGKHIVSWKWNDTWYAAVSNHDGETLASLVEPLRYQKRNQN